MTTVIECPNCGKKVAWTSENKYRPFCSERCELIDFGEWTTQNRYIPSDAEHDDVTASDLDKD